MINLIIKIAALITLVVPGIYQLNEESFIMENETPLIKGIVVKVFARLNKVFSVSFDVNPKSIPLNDANVIHLTIGGGGFTGIYGERTPAVFFNYIGNLCISFDMNGISNYWVFTNFVELFDKWSSVKISQEFLYNKYIYSIWVNRQIIFSTENTDAREYNNVKVFVANEWSTVQPGFIRNLIIKNGNLAIWTEWSDWSICNDTLGFMNRTRSCNISNIIEWCDGSNYEVIQCYESLTMKNETPLSQGNLVKTINRLNKVFSVSFEVKPTSFLNEYTNVIHLTIGGNSGVYGYRNPAVFFIPNQGNISICLTMNGNSNYEFQTNSVELGQWSSVKISHEFLYGKFMYSVLLNGQNIFSAENTDAREFNGVDVYASNIWTTAQPGFIRNLIIKNGNLDNLAFWLQWSSWSNCNDTYGFMNRTRSCNVSIIQESCDGSNYEVIQCYAFWTEWTSWSICNDTFGFMNRTRMCNVSNAASWCVGVNSEIIECYVYTNLKCPDGWLQNADSCYLYQNIKKTYQEALSSCESYGGSLLSIKDKAENDFISNFFSTRNLLDTIIWIGLDAIKNRALRKFEWSDGTPFLFTNWKNSEPNNIGGNEDCVVLNRGWNDNHCGNRFHYICKRKKAFWTEWTNWSVCNDSFGFMNRTRMCNILNAASWCVGVNSEIIECYVFWAQWSNWTNCIAGFMNRTRVCNTNTTTQCNGNSFEIIGCLDENETMWKVLNIVTLQTHLLIMNLQIYPLFQASLNAKVEFEYFLPAYVSFTAEGIVQRFNNTAGNRMKYSFNGILNSSESFNFNFTAIFNNTQCPIPGVFTLGIPLKVIAVVDNGSPTIFFKSFRKVVNCFGFQKIPIVPDKIKESYGRGIYWDTKSSHIYVCMNQHFPSSKVACYVSSDEGYLWNELDIRIGSILGQHSLSNELYAIHRNQKTFMMFHSVHKKWLSLTNYQFYDTAFNYIDLKMVKNLEGDYDQIYTLGPNQWLGNAQGLFLWFQGNSSWVLRITWRF